MQNFYNSELDYDDSDYDYLNPVKTKIEYINLDSLIAELASDVLSKKDLEKLNAAGYNTIIKDELPDLDSLIDLNGPLARSSDLSGDEAPMADLSKGVLLDSVSLEALPASLFPIANWGEKIEEEEVVEAMPKGILGGSSTTKRLNKMVDLVSELNEKYGYNHFDEKFLNGHYVTVTQHNFLEVYISKHTRAKKIHDVLINCFVALNRDNGFVNRKYIKENKLKNCQIKDVEKLLLSIDDIKLDILPNKEKRYHYKAKSNETTIYREYLLDSSKEMSAKLMTHGIIDSDLTINETAAIGFGTIVGFKTELKSILPPMEEILIKLKNDIELSEMSKENIKTWLVVFFDEKQTKIKKTASGNRKYSILSTFPKWLKQKYLSGYSEFDMKSAHLTLLGAMIENMMITNSKYYTGYTKTTELTLNSIHYNMKSLIDADIVGKLTDIIENEHILLTQECIDYMDSNIKDFPTNRRSARNLAKYTVNKFIYETNQLCSFGNKMNCIVEKMFFKYAEPIAKFLNYLKTCSQKSKKSVLHFEMTKIEQIVIEQIQATLYNNGIYTQNEHDGFLCKDLDKEKIDKLIIESLNYLETKIQTIKYCQIIRKVEY